MGYEEKMRVKAAASISSARECGHGDHRCADAGVPHRQCAGRAAGRPGTRAAGRGGGDHGVGRWAVARDPPPYDGAPDALRPQLPGWTWCRADPGLARAFAEVDPAPPAGMIFSRRLAGSCPGRKNRVCAKNAGSEQAAVHARRAVSKRPLCRSAPAVRTTARRNTGLR